MRPGLARSSSQIDVSTYVDGIGSLQVEVECVRKEMKRVKKDAPWLFKGAGDVGQRSPPALHSARESDVAVAAKVSG